MGIHLTIMDQNKMRACRMGVDAEVRFLYNKNRKICKNQGRKELLWNHIMECRIKVKK